MAIRRYRIFQGMGNKNTPKVCTTTGTHTLTNSKKECIETAKRLKECGTPYEIYDRIEKKIICSHLMD